MEMEKPIRSTACALNLDSSDEQLIEDARQDLRAFAELYDRYLPLVYRYLYTRLRNTTDVEDLTSQVFLSALEAFPRYQHQGSFGAWLVGIARNKSAEFFRAQARFEPLDAESEPKDSAAPLLAQMVRKEELRRLAGLVDGLQQEQQELVRLRFGAKLGFAEIARLLKRKETAVKMALYRTLQQLGKQMEAKDDA
jgi:RNA polymerase sigma-70 factor, ECF subfamily